ncbi:MAG: putrescine transport system permease protein [Aliidongia sp.]|nr:putrescine transport system permease protein [Aliidongia sp.]
MTGLRRWLPGRALVIGAPALWLGIFFLIPFFVVLKISLSTAMVAIPPYEPLIGIGDDGSWQLNLHIENFSFIFSDPQYVLAYLSSVRNAAVTALVCLLIGYPMAYAIARARPKRRALLLMLVVLPFWTSFLIRVYAWIGILKQNGLLNNFLLWLGVIDQPLTIMNTQTSVYIGMIYAYLPFMILPLYATLEKLDSSLLEAASDLGAKPIRAFLTITLPLSLPGIVAGALLVFIPAVGEFIIPTLLGGPDTLMIGTVLWNEFFQNRDWPVASTVAVALIVLLVVPLMLLQRAQARAAEQS